MILDTSFLIDVLRGNPGTEDIEHQIDKKGATVTPITIMELWEGIQRTERTDMEQQKVEELLDGLNKAEFTTVAAKTAGTLNAQLHEQGTPIDIEDIILGAIAHHRDEPIVTANVDHFKHIPDTELLTY
jgi:predicted nucleic acid-binding protein